MTYRLMAEWATDLACKKLAVDKKCQTAEICLPGSEDENVGKSSKKTMVEYNGLGAKAAHGRHGTRSLNINIADKRDESLVCECEGVSVAEVKYAIEILNAKNIINLRRRTRLGMGTCQGELCACRAAGLLADAHKCTERAKNDLMNFVNERWKGMYPVCWGDTLRESEYSQWVYSGVCGLEGTNDCETAENEKK